MDRDQYLMICARRQAYDNLVWQTPPLAIAAQAFLLAASFGHDTPQRISLVLAALSGLVGLASIQLMAKHHFHELCDSRILADYEAEHAKEGLSPLHGKRDPALARAHFLARFKAYWVWLSVLGGFCLLAAYAIVDAATR